MATKSHSPRRRIYEPEARAGLNPPLQKGEAVGMPELIKKLQGFVGNLLRDLRREDIHLLKDMDVLFLAHVLEDLWPHSDTNLPNMRLF